MMQRIEQIKCPGCGKVIGDLYFDNGRVYCAHGSILARKFIHKCSICGRAYHWHASEVERRAQQKSAQISG